MKFSGKVGNGPTKNDQITVAIRITVWIRGLFSGLVTIGRYGKWLTDTNLIRQMAALVRRALAEVCSVQVLLIKPTSAPKAGFRP